MLIIVNYGEDVVFYFFFEAVMKFGNTQKHPEKFKT